MWVLLSYQYNDSVTAAGHILVHVVTKDYKSAFSTTRVLQKHISVAKSILIEEVSVRTTLRDGTSFRRLASLIGLKYLHQPSNFVLNTLTLTCNV